MKTTFFAILLAFSTNLFAANMDELKPQPVMQQPAKIQLNIENQAPELAGYKLVVEIRRVNDPIFQESYDIDLDASSSKSIPLEVNFGELKGIAASNLIARLIKVGDEASKEEDHYVHSFEVNGVAGFKVVITPKNPENLALGNSIKIFPTIDAAGHNPVA
jgi:hypothetical protein